MKILALLLGVLTTYSAHADTNVKGEFILSLYGRAQCNTLKDTKGAATGYRISGITLALDETNLTLNGTLQSVRCVLVNETPTWTPHVLGAAVEYKSFEQTPRTVRLWSINSHIQAVNAAYESIATTSLNEVETQNISLEIPLASFLTEQNREELELTGKTNSEFKFGLRATSFYTIDNGPKQALGSRTAGSYLAKLIFTRDAQGNLSVSLR